VNHANIPSDRLAETNIDDCRVTLEVAKVYLAVHYEIAEYFDVPLGMVIERQPSHISNWMLGRDLSKMGVVSDGMNKERFPWVFGNKRSCQGAVVKCERTGHFRNVLHDDWHSLYPSIMIGFNLSPETVSLVSVKPYTGRYHFKCFGDYALVEIPETPKKEGDFPPRQVVARIDLSKDGVLRERQRNFLTMRKKTTLEARNNAFKVIGNAAYGYNINGWARWGNALVGILTAGIGRYTLNKTAEEKRAQKLEVVEMDTDGLYLLEAKRNGIDVHRDV